MISVLVMNLNLLSFLVYLVRIFTTRTLRVVINQDTIGFLIVQPMFIAGQWNELHWPVM